ncbi:DarT ssDNA thymidine ADP-ribosyltransferase family protein [Paenibacillus sp. LPE1-1-1.1]|uniref:DarT ssDNA thymidine ADP-ribosyltransferase family protein n=1 Tax=Paenibacillus sp. LPE1-1-1.1 TaxID=3135230 RepID=UPI00343B278D
MGAMAEREKERKKEYIAKRGIKHLYHFTRVENIENIFKYGVLPISELVKKEIGFLRNDINRHDKLVDFTSFSVSFPSYRMLYKLRQQNPEAIFVILELPIEIIFEKLSYYSYDNAAKMKNYWDRDGIGCLISMFENPFVGDREATNIPTHYPTSPEAEIQVVGKIESSLIQKIIIRDSDLLRRFESDVIKSRLFVVDPSLFERRMDWRFWQKIKY